MPGWLIQCMKLSFICGTGTAGLVMGENLKHICVRGWFTESQNCGGRKGLLEMLELNSLLKAGSAGGGCSGPC